MKTVLVLAYECAPYNRPGSTIGAQRPFQFAKHLPVFGWRSVILCCDFKSRYSLNNQSDWQSVIVERIDHYLENWDQRHESVIIPLPSLQYSTFADKLWLHSVTMNVQVGSFSAKPGFVNRIKRTIATFLKLFSGDHSQSWQDVAAYAGNIISQRMKLEMIIAEHSPDASVFAANRLHQQSGIPWVIDFRDPMLRDMKKLAREIYKRFTIPKFKSVAGTINVNDFWVEQDKKLFKKRGCTILNGFDPEDFELPKKKESLPELTIGYFGSIQSGQDINPFLQSLMILHKEVKVRFIYRGNLNKVIEKFFSGGMALNITVDSSASVPREVALALMDSCDVLLLLSLKKRDDIYLTNGLYPGKTFEYFALRKPILLSVGDDGMLDSLIVKGDIGRIGRDSISIAKLITEGYRQKQTGASIWNVHYTEDFVMQYTRERQTEKLAHFMEMLLGQHERDAELH